ncbi:hypothetical protein CEXT_53381 [Caerostris extrusa]|uniref:Secreted peptide n=1 Tax=Caerostris extrusa TaxID=172846 RepID=A0AAV4URF2_CAEEX|nr:hypothetical protein CEXT_53381 [Caerostris extrusa]
MIVMWGIPMVVNECTTRGSTASQCPTRGSAAIQFLTVGSTGSGSPMPYYRQYSQWLLNAPPVLVTLVLVHRSWGRR